MTARKHKSAIFQRVLDKAISFLVFSSLFISLFISIALTLALLFSFLLYGIPINVTLFLACFLATFSVYGINKMTDVDEDTVNLRNRARFVTQHRDEIEFTVAARFLQRSFSRSLIAFSRC